MDLLLACAIAVAVAAIATARLRGVALRIGLADEPGPRRLHAGRVPLVGGLGMYCGFALGAVALDMGLTPYRALFAAGAALVVVGVLDDLRDLSSRARFGAQIAAAILMALWGQVALEDLGALAPGDTVFDLGGWSMPFTVFATVGVINALNMTDGLDGLAGSLGLVALGGLLWVSAAAGRGPDVAILAVLAAVLLVFLAFNLPLPGRPGPLAFMGDAGSMLLGFALTWFVIALSQGEGRAMPPVLALWLLLVPLYDTVWLLLRRPLTGRWPTAPDLTHLHHVLRMAGLGTRGTLAVAVTIALAGAAVGLTGHHLGWSERTMFHGFLAGFAGYCVVMGIAWRYGRLLLWRLDRRLAASERRGDEERRGEDRRRGEQRRQRVDRRRR